ncbi:MAG: dihydroorotate oxidase [Patescibacteria group bacterium]|nr:dihydroorotate oxidase [Patescibacteria group bacterium]
MIHPPFFDTGRSFEENVLHGPFNAFADGEVFLREGEPQHRFLGFPVYLPFGIPAGPLPTARFAKAAFEKGFDLPVYKTVRTRELRSHPWPNVLPVEVDGDLTLEKRDKGLVVADDFREPLAITNSFGVPSSDPSFWQEDMREAVQAAGKGQVLIASFQGTNRGEGVDAFVGDYVLGARLVKETGAQILEVNYSCPNEGTTNLLCYDTDRIERISARIKDEIGNTPLLIKLAYFESQEHLRDMVRRLGKIVDGFAAINTIGAAVRNKDGSQALPGEGRLVSGICGAPIKWAGIDMVQRLKALREELGYSYAIVGTGGVTKPEDYAEYRAAGADAVMSATGAMWNPYLAKETQEYVKKHGIQ